ncbi:MAG: ABC transporter permease [Gammaproteobacteria bacterium]|nr:ABC transporter permease [Gammaproteobacteria bacterium]
MKTLDRKLLRDLWHMRGQAIAIALVIVSGVATFIMSLSTLHSLQLTQATFYQDYRFADVFVSLKRAPEALRARIAEIPGVDKVETRVVTQVNLDIEGFSDPVRGQVLSIPDEGESILNRLYLRQGRLVDSTRDREVVLTEAFAQAHGLKLGDSLHAIINGRRKALTIVGIVLSPEYIYQLGPGDLSPDFKHYGIMWMARKPLGTAYDMEDAFNDVVLTLFAGSQPEDVIDRLDDLLEPYGGLGAYEREDQISHRYLSEDFKQLGQMATIFPIIFLGVAAFLLNVAATRLISTQREQIAALKAFGYSNLDVGLHYQKLIIVVVLVGVVGGLGVGVWLGTGLSEIYMQFYRFPFLKYELQPGVVMAAVVVSVLAAVFGTSNAVRKAILLPPAEAMRPEPPAGYRQTLIERLGLQRMFSQPTRMIARHLERRPVKSLLSVAGIAFACAIMMVGRFQEDAIEYMVDVQFELAQRQDLTVTFVEPTSGRGLYELQSLQGVEHAEAFRVVPARLRFGHRSYRTSIQGIEPDGVLQRLLDAELKPIELPPAGVILTKHLSKMLGIRPGDLLTVEVLEGRRPVREVPVVALVKEYVGLSAYMERSALNRLMHEGNAISGVHLSADIRYESEIYTALKKTPRVAGTVARENAIRNLFDSFGDTLLIFTFVNTLLAGTIAFGVVYNSARIAVSERSRELASLRVLGFTRAEISYILLGELGALTLVAIPFGLVIGLGLCAYIASGLQTDLYRVPLILEPSTYAFAATVVLLSACISGLMVRRHLDHLDLVAVLKTKE